MTKVICKCLGGIGAWNPPERWRIPRVTKQSKPFTHIQVGKLFQNNLILSEDSHYR